VISIHADVLAATTFGSAELLQYAATTAAYYKSSPMVAVQFSTRRERRRRSADRRTQLGMPRM
jgi:hypothetical protein